MPEQTIPFTLTSDNDETDGEQTVTGWVEITSSRIDIHFDGYTTHGGGEEGSVVLLDNFYGHPTVYIWNDPNSDDPHKISLEKAKVTE